MYVHIERIRQGFSEKLLFKKDDVINLHFKFPDGEVIHFENVPFDLLMANIQAYRKTSINGFDQTLFREEKSDDDNFDLEEYIPE